MTRYRQTVTGRPSQEEPAVSIDDVFAAEHERNDAVLASRLRDVPTDQLRWSLDTVKRFDGIVRAELARRGVRIERPRPEAGRRKEHQPK